MKRDMDLIRTIMIAIEGSEGRPDLRQLIDTEVSDEILNYHSYLIADAGFGDGIKLRGTRDQLSPGFILVNLTWAGHEFLDNARNESRWAQAKTIASAAGSLSLGVVSETLALLAKHAAANIVMRIVN